MTESSETPESHDDPAPADEAKRGLIGWVRRGRPASPEEAEQPEQPEQPESSEGSEQPLSTAPPSPAAAGPFPPAVPPIASTAPPTPPDASLTPPDAPPTPPDASPLASPEPDPPPAAGSEPVADVTAPPSEPELWAPPAAAAAPKADEPEPQHPASVWLVGGSAEAGAAREPASRSPEPPRRPAPWSSSRSSRDELGPAIVEVDKRVSAVEQRAMESLEVEINTLMSGLDAAAARQDRVEATLAELAQDRRRIDDELLRLREDYGREQSALSQAADSMLSRVEALERGIVDVDRRARQGDELAKALNRYQAPHRTEPETDDDGRVELNAASFEDLRGLDLSVTQAARLIALRDARGGLKSLDDLAELPGFPEEQIAHLLTRARIALP